MRMRFDKTLLRAMARGSHSYQLSRSVLGDDGARTELVVQSHPSDPSPLGERIVDRIANAAAAWKPGVIQIKRLVAKIVIEVFHFDRPTGRKGPFDAGYPNTTLFLAGVTDTNLISSPLSCGCSGVLSLRHFRLARWCSLSLGGWWPRNPARRSTTCSGRLGGAAAAGRTIRW